MPSNPALDFSKRVAPRDLPELMDGECSYEEFRACLRSLEQVNRLFAGYRPTLAWLDAFPRNHAQPLRILDVGFGGGDMLRRIHAWAQQRDIAVKLTGIDLNPHATRAAHEFTPAAMQIQYITGDALHFQPAQPPHIIISALTAHHLEDEQIVALLQWMERTAQRGWFINDLERSAKSYKLFGWAAKLFGWHRFVQHDGPVSFRRALSREDWQRLLAQAGIPSQSVTIKAWRPSRLCVGRKK